MKMKSTSVEVIRFVINPNEYLKDSREIFWVLQGCEN